MHPEMWVHYPRDWKTWALGSCSCRLQQLLTHFRASRSLLRQVFGAILEAGRLKKNDIFRVSRDAFFETPFWSFFRRFFYTFAIVATHVEHAFRIVFYDTKRMLALCRFSEVG